jgi:hypothetical protein
VRTKDFFPLLLLLVGAVVLMAGAGKRGVRAGGSIFLVMGVLILLAVIFGLILARTR